MKILDWATALFMGAMVSSFVVAPAVAGDPCPKPTPAQIRGTSNAQRIAFTFRSETFPLELFSAYSARQPNNFCLHYAAENLGPRPILKFSWPLATLEIDTLAPRERLALAHTTWGKNPPQLDETWVYAFLSGAAKSVAYQHQAHLSSTALPIWAHLQLPSPTQFAPVRLAQLGGRLEFHQFKEAEALPEVGSTFSGSDSVMTAVSAARWDGKSYSFSFSIHRNDPKMVNKARAPFAAAFQKIGSGADIIPLIRQFRDIEIFGQGNDFEVRTTIPPIDEVGLRLYLVQQPIVFERPNGRVCFLAPAYSPIPIPAQILSCSSVS